MSENVKDITKVKHKNQNSTMRVIWREIYTDKLALISLFVFITLVAAIYISSSFIIDHAAATRLDLFNTRVPPGRAHLLGTDNAGRDILRMIAIGGRNTLTVGFGITALSGVVGIFVGLVAGYYGKHVDNVIMRLIDFWSMMPFLMMIIVIVSIIPRYTVVQFILIMSVFGWAGRARQIRSQTLQQANLDYVHACKTLGTRNFVIMLREVLPNLVSLITVNLTLSLAGNMGMETGLTFLGFGLPINSPSLGRMIGSAADFHVLRNEWWLWLPAAATVFILMLCICFVGQALNRAADPKQRRR